MKNSSSSQIVASTGDVVIEILLRIPIKPLLRFKLVSKLWLSIINDPSFNRRRNPKPKPAVGLFFRNEDKHHNYVSFFPHHQPNDDVPPLNSSFTYVDSCNGLMLCLSPHHNYYIYNPTTNQSRLLPERNSIPQLEPKEAILRRLFESAYLAFDQVHYDVVCLRPIPISDENRWYGSWNYQIQVYSSKSGSWGTVTKARIESIFPGVFCNGSIHWLSRENFGASQRFVIDQQLVLEMPNPPVSDTFKYFGQSNDHLYCICKQSLFSGSYDVFEMMMDYSEWIVQYRISYSSFDDLKPSAFDRRRWKMLCLVRGEKEVDSFLVLQIQDKIIRYNLASETFESIYISECGVHVAYEGIIQYIESVYCVQ